MIPVLLLLLQLCVSESVGLFDHLGETPILENRVTLPPVDNQQLIDEDGASRRAFRKQILRESGHMPGGVVHVRDPVSGPFKFGHRVPIDIDIHTNWTWTQRPSYKYWSVAIKSENAVSLSLLFDQFYLPAGAELYVRGSEDVLGPFTDKQNKKHGKFSTVPLDGQDLLVEYFEPPEVDGRVELKIGAVVHGFRGAEMGKVDPSCTSKGVFDDAHLAIDGADIARFWSLGRTCHVNAPACIKEEYPGMVNASRSVARMISSRGEGSCSGAMINTVGSTGKQYFLTAAHCVRNPADLDYALLEFNYESPTCLPLSRVRTMRVVHGLVLIAKNYLSDFALLEVQEPIPASYNVYLAGWSLSKRTTGYHYTIHHPNLDPKRVSTTGRGLAGEPWEHARDRAEYHRTRGWDVGATDRGSSGAPLFNERDQIVGQLQGGYSSCRNPEGDDLFGLLRTSYNGSQVVGKRLCDWLNPAGEEVEGVEGCELEEARGIK